MVAQVSTKWTASLIAAPVAVATSSSRRWYARARSSLTTRATRPTAPSRIRSSETITTDAQVSTPTAVCRRSQLCWRLCYVLCISSDIFVVVTELQWSSCSQKLGAHPFLSPSSTLLFFLSPFFKPPCLFLISSLNPVPPFPLQFFSARSSCSPFPD